MKTKTCAVSGKQFKVTDFDLAFYAKMGLSEPSLCPDERCRRRLGWQNMRKLYRRKCDATGKMMISNISQDKNLTVYDQNYWWSDKWDFRDYGQDFDFSRPFFEQWGELLARVPQPCMLRNHWLDENCDYTNYAGNNKDCYLIFHADMNRDCLYGVGVKKCVNAVDVIHAHGSELLYECVDCRNGYNLRYSQNSENCSESWFLKNCIGCKNCFGCVNLRNKEYYFLNESLGKEAYEKKIKSLELQKYSSVKKLRDQYMEFLKQFPHRATEGYQNENCSGDQVFRCQNVKECFDVQESRDMRYCHRVYNGPNSDCMDMNEYGMQIQQVYEGLAIGINANNVIGGIYVNEQVSDICYGMHNHHSHDLFGCIGGVRGKYCILNKQYEKDAYFELKEKIIAHMKKTGEWGEFFPLELSPFGYNETVASEYFPLEKEEILARGLRWKEEEVNADYQGAVYEIPDSIGDVGDDVLDKILTCSVSGRNFRLTKLELGFYRQMQLPIPRVCSDERHNQRMKLRNARKLCDRECAECGETIRTTYEKDRPEKILCEKCYEKKLN